MTKAEIITIRRAPRDGQHPYMQLYRKVPQDLTLSLEERGLLIYILSLPISQLTDMQRLGKQNGIGKNKIREMIRRLKELGYCQSLQIKDEKGRYVETQYLFYEERIQVFEDQSKNPEPENRFLDKNGESPAPENRLTETGLRNQVNGSLENENENLGCHNILDTSFSKSKDTPLPPKGESANADVGVSHSSSAKSEEEKFVDQFVETIKEFKPDYAVPKKRVSWIKSAKKLLVEQNRKPDVVLKVLAWALRDNQVRGDWNGWSSKVLLSKNPVEYIGAKFDGMETSMKATKKRSFLPDSDDDEAIRMMKECYKSGEV